MENSIEQVRRELLAFCTGEPIIITLNAATEAGDEYNLQVFVRSVADFTPSYIQSVQLRLFLPSDYPSTSPKMRLHKTTLFHPNFTASGEWVDNIIRSDETIEDYLMRLIRVLQYKEINTEVIANRNAMAWFNQNRNIGIFPTDRVNYNAKPRIIIKKINNASFN